MWLEIEYSPTSLFSFKDINATNTAATSLLFPTPFGVKMAIISEAIQKYDLAKGEEVFKLIKDKKIRFNIPKEAVVNKTFGRITDLRNKVGRSKPAYREYVFFNGELKIAIDAEELSKEEINLLKRLFVRVNYFGKRASFMQFKSFNETKELGNGYLQLMGEEDVQLANKSIIQLTEDIPPEATFAEINIYNSEEKLKRKNNKRIFTVNLEETLSGEGYQYYKIANS
ncbi:hypothetical protein Halha_0960 [Halobacteroides halobius DSM 5150]|uniref:CRISPR-associated protein Cas5 n=1 Tax=Halobacteroides halobius (strain ATCC 35273 / DSM 5150 / MD-1) TaxID=748449 RepID=L0K7D8_HALHC|nr:hypothetical protein [Halobacteroides halobius]AGB40921.1 hypothetical protein Halha_0960 [Halobacteroides halobius DSM 5150]